MTACFDPPMVASLRKAAVPAGKFLFAEDKGRLWHFPMAPAAGEPVCHTATHEMPAAWSRRALARAIRQDLWRSFRAVRGFWPIVAVTRHPGAAEVLAGGFVPRAAPGLAGRIDDIFDATAWRRWARDASHIKKRGEGTCSARS